MQQESDIDALAGVLSDPIARHILLTARSEYISVDDLSDSCDASLPTIYRRLKTLRRYNLVTEHAVLGDNGCHFMKYKTNVRRITGEITDRGLELHVILNNGETPITSVIER